MSRNTWHLLPPAEDVVAEVETLRFDWLTFSRSSAQAEDVSLFQRDERRTIALYSSVAKIAARGRFYSDDATRDYDVVDYNIDVSVDPGAPVSSTAARGWRSASARPRCPTSCCGWPTRSTVRSVTSVEYGPLLHLRVRGQNALLVSLPRVAAPGFRPDADRDLLRARWNRSRSTWTPSRCSPDPQEQACRARSIEPHFLLSNRVVWYPQNPVSDYATGTAAGDGAVRAIARSRAARRCRPRNVVSLRDLLTQPGAESRSPSAPISRFATWRVAVARFVRADERNGHRGHGAPGNRHRHRWRWRSKRTRGCRRAAGRWRRSRRTS